MANMVANVNENECQQFQTLLIELQSPDNDVRKKAESTYDEIVPDRRLLLLFNSLCNMEGNEEVAIFSTILMRKLLYSEFADSFGRLPPESQAQIKNHLLVALQQSISPALRKKIGDVVSELARNLIDDEGNNHWPEFLKFLFESANSSNPALKESSLLMFASVPGVFGNLQMRYLDVIRQMLIQCLQDQTSEAVSYAAVKALTAFIVAHEKEINIHKNFTDCLPLLIQVLSNALSKQDDEAENVLKNIVDVTEACPYFFRGQLDAMLQLLMRAMSDENSSSAIVHTSLEIIVTLAEVAPAMVRKLGTKCIKDLVPFVLKMMVDLPDIDKWDFMDEITDDESDSNAVIGESALDRLACALGGKTILPLVMGCLPQLLNSQNWKERYAGLMSLSAVGEGCNKQMEEILAQIVDGIVPFLQDPHSRVRYAACNALGQMASDFSPVFEKKFHDKVIPFLLEVMSDSGSPRVQAHAGAALVNFFEECPKYILAPYLENVVEKLDKILNAKFTELVEKGTKLVLEQTVVTIASLADTAQEKFVQYYDKFMPCLKYIIQNANTPVLKLLRGKTIECVSLIGLAVGKDKFIQDASDIMNMLLETQTSDSAISDDDPQLAYMISAWARICRILGKSFEPYLPFVMGPVMKTAGYKPEIAVLDGDDMKVVEEEEDWEFVSLGEQQNIGIRTSGLEEKATACQMLVCYAKELKEAFSPYVEEVVKLMVPMLKFYFHDGVRAAAAECMPYLLECARIQGEAYISEMWRYILPELLQAIESEPEGEVIIEHMHSLAQCIEILGGHCVPGEHMETLLGLLDVKLKEHFERAEKRQEKRNHEDYDEILEEELLEEDDDDVFILSKVADILHSLFASYKSDFFPLFDVILPHFIRLIQADRPWPDRQWAICVFDDVIEHGGPACRKYQQYFLQPMIAALSDKSPEVRQAAAYGFGVLGLVGGLEFANICAEAVPALVQMINAPDSRNQENAVATENAIAAVTKILVHNNSCISMDDLIPMWMTWLPVWEDEDEAPHVYNFFCTLLEQNNPLLLGENNCNLPRIVIIAAEAFNKQAIEVDSDVGKRLINLMKVIQSNGEIFSVCISQLTPEQQEALQAALTTSQ